MQPIRKTNINKHVPIYTKSTTCMYTAYTDVYCTYIICMYVCICLYMNFVQVLARRSSKTYFYMENNNKINSHCDRYTGFKGVVKIHSHFVHIILSWLKEKYFTLYMYVQCWCSHILYKYINIYTIHTYIIWSFSLTGIYYRYEFKEVWKKIVRYTY